MRLQELEASLQTIKIAISDESTTYAAGDMKAALRLQSEKHDLENHLAELKDSLRLQERSKRQKIDEASRIPLPQDSPSSAVNMEIVNVPTHNSFSSLNLVDPQPLPPHKDTTATSLPPAPAAQQSRLKKPPPIMLLSSPTIFSTLGRMQRETRVDYSARTSGDYVRIVVNSSREYNQVRDWMQSNKVAGHTYQMPEDRPLQYFLKGIPRHVPKEEVKAALEEQGYTIDHIDYYKSLKLQDSNGYPLLLPHLVIRLKQSDHHKNIINLHNINGLTVNISQYTPPRQPIQCKLCQRFGHTKHYCSHPARCVRCTGDHDSASCPLPRRGEPDHPDPVCVNCTKSHPTNYRGCEIAIAEKRRIQFQTQQKPRPADQGPPLAGPRPSYAAMAAPRTLRPPVAAVVSQVSKPPPPTTPADYPHLPTLTQTNQTLPPHNTTSPPTHSHTPQSQVEEAIALLYQVPLTNLTQLLTALTKRLSEDTQTSKILLITDILLRHILAHE